MAKKYKYLRIELYEGSVTEITKSKYYRILKDYKESEIDLVGPVKGNNGHVSYQFEEEMIVAVAL